MPDPLKLTIVPQTGKVFETGLRRHLRAARMLVRSPLRQMALVLVNDSTMSELHRRYMNVRSLTDVLTFPIDVDARGKALTGEVYVCVPEARRRAKQHGTRAADEVLLYALHGMLHLCGFDDRTPAGFARMHRTEDRILTSIGIGPVFHPAHAPRAARRARPARASKSRLADAFTRRVTVPKRRGARR